MLLPQESGRELGVAEGRTERYCVGDLLIDTQRGEVHRGGQRLPIERSGIALLCLLVRRAGQVVSKGELLRAGWPGRVVSENSLAKAISKLRQQVGDERAELIAVVHGFGYRLNAVITAAEDHVLPQAEGFGSSRRGHVPARTQHGLAALLLAGLALLIFAAWWAQQWRTPAADARVAVADEDVIAVMPLRDDSVTGSLAVLADGIGNHLRDQAQRIPALRIISRGEVAGLSTYPLDPESVASSLGANLVLWGEVSEANERLQVTLRLHDSLGRVPAWSKTFERAPADQARLLDELTAALYEGLGDQPARWAYDPQRGRGTSNPEAYRTFLRAATLFAGNNDPNSQRRTMAVLEEALTLDPGYADALLMLAGIYGGSGYYADSAEELVAGRKRGLEMINRGIAMVPDDPINYLYRSEMRLLYAFDWQGAEADIEAAAARTPAAELATLLIWKARLVASKGQIDEAIALDARANRLDPEAGGRRNQGWHYLAKRDTANARAVLMLQLADLPENPHTNFYLALCDIFEGQPQEALPRLEHSSTLFRLLGTVIAQHELGNRAASDLALQKLMEQFAIADGYWVGAAHAWRGDIDEAFVWLERAANGGDSSIMYLAFDPLLHRLRDDPRYFALLQKLGVQQ